MNRILIPLDGSDLAEAIVPVAAALARAHKAELLLLRAVPPKSGHAESEQHDAKVYLARMSEKLQDRGVDTVRVLVTPAKPEQAIVEAAAEHHVDLIAMTTHGRTGLSRLLIGSVAESVVRHALAPVLVVRGQPTWLQGEPRRVLVPLDGSELSAAILPVVERLAGPLEFEVHLLHAIEPMPAAAGVSARMEEVQALREREAEGYLDKVAGAIEAEGLSLRRVIRIGPAVQTIQRYVHDAGIDLIAMTTHGRTGLNRLLIGSVAERVLRAVTVPLVLWKPRRDDR